MVENFFLKKVNAETCRRISRRNYFHGWIARKKTFCSDRYKNNCLEIAKQYIDKDLDFLKRVIFSDESQCKFWSR